MKDEDRIDSVQDAQPEGPVTEAGRRAVDLRRLASEVAGLEEEHRALSERRRQLQADVALKRLLTQERSQAANEFRRRLAKLRAVEHAAMEELAFLEEEKAGQEAVLAASTERLRAHLDEVEKTTRQIEFIKGELEALALHVETFKDKVPSRFASMNYLEGKITQAEKEFMHLIDRMKQAGKGLNLAYYQKKRELRRKYDPYGFEG